MGAIAEQEANVLPPRRGQVIALGTDSTARAYDLTALAMAEEFVNTTRQNQVFVTLTAWGTNVWFYFSSTSTADLDDTASLAAGSALAFTNAHGVPLADGLSVDVRIDRHTDKYLVVKTASGTSGKLYIAPSSEAF